MSTNIDHMSSDSEDFVRAFGEALDGFLKTNGISESDASRRMGMERATLNTYTHGLTDGKRRRPTAEVLAKACILGFVFEYGGHQIVALRNGERIITEERQLHLEFTRELDLTANGGAVAVGLKRPPGRVALTVSLRAIS
jgi:transcriptional regulator with XRE-family HTH domain